MSTTIFTSMFEVSTDAAVENLERQALRVAMGLSSVPQAFEGVPRLRRRLAKKVLADPKRYRQHVVIGAWKTVFRHRNRVAKKAWELLDEAEKKRRLDQARRTLFLSVGTLSIGVLAFAGRGLTTPPWKTDDK